MNKNRAVIPFFDNYLAWIKRNLIKFNIAMLQTQIVSFLKK